MASAHYLRIFKEFNINSTALRLFNVYGPGQCLIDLKQGMVSIYIAMAIKNSKINIKGSLDRVRDFIYIDDVINFWFKAINLDFYNHHTLNLGTGLGIKISNLVEKIIHIISKPIEIKIYPPTPCDQKII